MPATIKAEDYVGPRKKFDLNRSLLDTRSYAEECSQKAARYKPRDGGLERLWGRRARSEWAKVQALEQIQLQQHRVH